MKSIYLSLCVVATIALGGCATTRSTNATTSLSKTDLETASVISDSVLRIGSEVSFGLKQGSTNTNYTISCNDSQAWLLYSQQNLGRRYPNGAARYSARRQVSAELAAQLKALPAIVKSCQVVPKLREVRREKEGNVTLIDINSIEKIGNQLVFWGAFDYPDLALDVPYQAPYGQKFERFSLSCVEQKYVQLSGFDVDADNRVTDGLVFGDKAAQEKIQADTNADYKDLFSVACGATGKLAALPVSVPRKKVFPDSNSLKTPDAEVLKSIEALQMPFAKKKLKKIVLEGTSNYRGKDSFSKEQIEFSSYPGAGMSSIVSTGFDKAGPTYRGTSIDFLGLIKLSSATKYSQQSTGSDFSRNLAFSGDWVRMEIGSEITYTSAMQSTATMAGTWNKESTNRCKVIEKIDASTLHPALTGRAKRLECQTDKDEYKRINTCYYLEDYAYIVSMQTSKNKFYYSTKKIVEVEQ